MPSIVGHGCRWPLRLHEAQTRTVQFAGDVVSGITGWGTVLSYPMHPIVKYRCVCLCLYVAFFPFFFLLFSLSLLVQPPQGLNLALSGSHTTHTPNSREQGALLDCIALFQHGQGLSAAAGRPAGLGSVGGQMEIPDRISWRERRKKESGDSRLFCGDHAAVVGYGWLCHDRGVGGKGRRQKNERQADRREDRERNVCVES